ncbi:MAG: hypothetical protein ACRDIC_20435, partial [bacterium]
MSHDSRDFSLGAVQQEVLREDGFFTYRRHRGYRDVPVRFSDVKVDEIPHSGTWFRPHAIRCTAHPPAGGTRIVHTRHHTRSQVAREYARNGNGLPSTAPTREIGVAIVLRTIRVPPQDR